MKVTLKRVTYGATQRSRQKYEASDRVVTKQANSFHTGLTSGYDSASIDELKTDVVPAIE